MEWQGRQDLNLQPTVLETATLPIELLPYILIKQCNFNKPSATLKLVVMRVVWQMSHTYLKSIASF